MSHPLALFPEWTEASWDLQCLRITTGACEFERLHGDTDVTLWIADGPEGYVCHCGTLAEQILTAFPDTDRKTAEGVAALVEQAVDHLTTYAAAAAGAALADLGPVRR
jgi:hypothetical protein